VTRADPLHGHSARRRAIKVARNRLKRKLEGQDVKLCHASREGMEIEHTQKEVGHQGFYEERFRVSASNKRHAISQYDRKTSRAC
jgi:hypothetical protein